MLKKIFLMATLMTVTLQGRPIENFVSLPDSSSSSPCPDYPVYHAAEGYPASYEPYPGMAYERSISTTQIVTTVVVSVAFFTIVGVVLANTPHHHHGHGHADGNHDCCHHH